MKNEYYVYTWQQVTFFGTPYLLGKFPTKTAANEAAISWANHEAFISRGPYRGPARKF